VIPHQLEDGCNEELDLNLPEFFNLQNFNLVHAGNLLWGRDPNGLILGFRKFLETNSAAKKDARLLFLGGANHYSDVLSNYERKISQFNASSDYLPFKMVQSIQKQASVNIILE